MLGADPDVESGFKELIMLKGLYHSFENALRNRYCTAEAELTLVSFASQ